MLTARKSSGQSPPPAFALQLISSRPADAWNRLVQVRADDGGLPGALIATYRYNGLNHRVQKILWDDADPQTPDTTIDYYHNAGWQVVEERVDGDVHVQYLWCLSYIDTPILRWRDTTGNEELDETLYYTVDANKNVTALIDATTGNVVERYLYDPYGRVMVLDDGWNTVAWSASRKNEILFAGYRYNPETGYYQARHREYHALLGRFMQRDPLGYVDGGNLYAAYFVMWGGVDPTGTERIEAGINVGAYDDLLMSYQASSRPDDWIWHISKGRIIWRVGVYVRGNAMTNPDGRRVFVDNSLEVTPYTPGVKDGMSLRNTMRNLTPSSFWKRPTNPAIKYRSSPLYDHVIGFPSNQS